MFICFLPHSHGKVELHCTNKSEPFIIEYKPPFLFNEYYTYNVSDFHRIKDSLKGMWVAILVSKNWDWTSIKATERAAIAATITALGGNKNVEVLAGTVPAEEGEATKK